MELTYKIETPRLRLREARAPDAAFFLELMNTEKYHRYIGDRNLRTTSDAEAFIQERFVASYRANGYGLWVMELKSGSRPIGICGLVNRDYLDHPDLGFAVLPGFERQGYSYEASLACLQYGRKELAVECFLAITVEENLGSRKLLEKLGFSLQEYIEEPGSGEELLLYQLS